MDNIIWKDIKIKKLINDISDGATPSTIDENNFGKGIPWVVVEDIQPEIWQTQQELTEKGFKNCSAKKWQPGTVILSTGATIGKVGIAKVELCTKQGITGIVCNEFLLPEFLKYWFENNINQLLKYSQGTTIKEIRSRAINNFNLRLPNPLTKESIIAQERVIKFLIAVDIVIEKTRLSIEKAENLRKSLMQNLLTGKLKPDGTWRKKDEFCLNKSDSISMKALQIFLNKLRPINWKFIGLKRIINLVYGSSLADYSETKGNYPVYGSNGIIGYTDNYLIKGPGIIVGRKGTIGAVNWTNENFYPIDTTYYVDIIDKEINLKWVYYILNFLNLPKLNSATGVPGLNKSDALSLYTIVPPIEEQLSIVSTLEQFESEMQSKEKIITKLYRLKKSLLQNLLTGKVKIKN